MKIDAEGRFKPSPVRSPNGNPEGSQVCTRLTRLKDKSLTEEEAASAEASEAISGVVSEEVVVTLEAVSEAAAETLGEVSGAAEVTLEADSGAKEVISEEGSEVEEAATSEEAEVDSEVASEEEAVITLIERGTKSFSTRVIVVRNDSELN